MAGDLTAGFIERFLGRRTLGTDGSLQRGLRLTAATADLLLSANKRTHNGAMVAR